MAEDQSSGHFKTHSVYNKPYFPLFKSQFSKKNM